MVNAMSNYSITRVHDTTLFDITMFDITMYSLQ